MAMTYTIHLMFCVALSGQGFRVKMSSQDSVKGQLQSGTEGLQAGALMLDRYELISEIRAWPRIIEGFAKISYLGKGTFGETWLALDKTRNTKVAIKFFYRNLRKGVLLLNMENADAQEKLKLGAAAEECYVPTAIIQAKQNPAGQARFAECLENAVNDENYAHLVLEVAGTKNLEQFVKAKGGLSDATIMRFAKQMLEGLAQMEGLFVHKDIKPANLMVSKGVDGEFNLKYIDFGLVGGENLKSGVVGTPMFMPPDMWPVVPSDPIISHKFDIYSAGETLYSLICGKTFHEYIFDEFGHLEEEKIGQKLKTLNPADYCNSPPGLDSLKSLVIGKMMQPSPSDRVSASELLQDRIFNGEAHEVVIDDGDEPKEIDKPSGLKKPEPIMPVVVEGPQVIEKPNRLKKPEPIVPVVVDDDEVDEENEEDTFIHDCHASKSFWFRNRNQCCLREKYDELRDAICHRPCGPKIAYRNGQCENDCNYKMSNPDTFNEELQCCVAKVWATKCIYRDEVKSLMWAKEKELENVEGWQWMFS